MKTHHQAIDTTLPNGGLPTTLRVLHTEADCPTAVRVVAHDCPPCGLEHAPPVNTMAIVLYVLGIATGFSLAVLYRSWKKARRHD